MDKPLNISDAWMDVLHAMNSGQESIVIDVEDMEYEKHMAMKQLREKTERMKRHVSVSWVSTFKIRFDFARTDESS